MSGRGATYNASEYLLVVARTQRPDALNNFRMYTDGWNLSSTSYLASAGFVGMPLFVISLIWILMGFTYMVVVTCMYYCWKDNLKSEPDFGRFGNYTTLVLVIAFTVITISGCGALFVGQEELHSELNQVFMYLTTQVAQAANDSVQAVPPTAVADATHAAEVLENTTSSISTTVHQTLDQICFWLIVLGSCACDFFNWLGFVAIGWLGVIGLWFLGGLFLLVYAVFGDTCAAIDEWTTNPRNGTAFDIIVRCELNHTKPTRGRRHTSMGDLLPAAAGDEDELVFPQYKPLSDLTLLPALPPLPKLKSLKDLINDEKEDIPTDEEDIPTETDEEEDIPFPQYSTNKSLKVKTTDEEDIPFPEYKSLNNKPPKVTTTDEEEIPFPEYKFLNGKPSKDTTDEEETPFPGYKSLKESSYNWDDYNDDDPNDAREFWAELIMQQEDAAAENESCTILQAAFVPILDNIYRYNCPSILRNTLWVTLSMVIVSGGSMFTVCLWIVITRRSTMRWRKMEPATNDQLPFYAYVFQDFSAPVPKKSQYVGYSRNVNVGGGVGVGVGVEANPNYDARPRRSAQVYSNTAEMVKSAYAERRRNQNNRR